MGPTFEDHPHVFSHKRSNPLEFTFDTCASASSSYLFWLVKLNICGCNFFQKQMYFQQKTCVLHFGRAFRTNVPLCTDKCIFGTKPTALRFDRLRTQRRKPYWIHKAVPLQPQRSRCYQHPVTLCLNLPPSGFCCCGGSGSPCQTCQPDADATARWIHWGTTGQHALAPELCGQGG